MRPLPRPALAEILARMPGLEPYGREAALLDPEPGMPSIHDSSIGGRLLWPLYDPWPTCSLPDEADDSGLAECAMVPVAQVFARDVPGPWWPKENDLLQILWCPNAHGDPPRGQAGGAPAIALRWRRTTDIGDVLPDPPAPVRYGEDGYVLAPCAVTTESITDFPGQEEMPEDLRPHLLRLVEETAPEPRDDVITRVAGWKLGGWPTWQLTDGSTDLPCDTCGTAMPLLFTIPGDDRVGRRGDLRVFNCPEHPAVFHANRL